MYKVGRIDKRVKEVSHVLILTKVASEEMMTGERKGREPYSSERGCFASRGTLEVVIWLFLGGMRWKGRDKGRRRRRRSEMMGRRHIRTQREGRR